jgi:DNA-binding beta-propeller fold protein YncE
MRLQRLKSGLTAAVLLLVLIAGGGAASALFAFCGPFTDVGTLICPFVLELYYSGITAGTSSTTFSPNNPVTRGQVAVFTSTALDLSLARSSRRAALGQWWTTTPHFDAGFGLTTVGSGPLLLKSDGADVWVAAGNTTVSRVRASDGRVLGTWTGAFEAVDVLVVMGRVFVTDGTIPGSLYMIDPTQPPGAMTTVSNGLGNGPAGITFDGSSIWTANAGNGVGSVSKITPGTSPASWTVSTFTTGFSAPAGAVFTGSNVWITDFGDYTLKKLNSDGSIAQSVSVGAGPEFPAYDGRNIWVPNSSDNSMTVVRASDGAVLQSFSATNGNQNGLSQPIQVAFDGQRILVTNFSGSSVSLFKAADLSIIGNVPTPGMTQPLGVASDGVNFWISDYGSNTIGRF